MSTKPLSPPGFNPTQELSNLESTDLTSLDPLDFPYTPHQWKTLSFLAATTSDYTATLEWMTTHPFLLQTKHPSTLQTLLHAAVSSSLPENVGTLLSQETINAVDGDGKTALELAISLGDEDVVMEFAECLKWMVDLKRDGADEPCGALEAMIEKAKDMECYPALLEGLKTAHISNWIQKSIYDCLNYLKEPESTHWWWTPGQWSNDQHFQIYNALVWDSDQGNHQTVKHLLSITKITLKPLLHDVLASDAAALGSWRRLEEPSRDEVESCKIQYLTLLMEWNNQVETLKSCIDWLVIKHEVFSEVSHRLCVVPKFLNTPSHETFEIVKMFAERLDEDGLDVLPTVHTLVEANQLEILKWMVEENYIDMTFVTGLKTRLTSEDAESPTTTKGEYIEDPCSICLCAKEFPVALHDNHTFCLACISEYLPSDIADSDDEDDEAEQSNSEKKRCPLCNHLCKTPHMIAMSARLISDIEQSHSWLTFGDNWPIYKILLGLAAGTDSVIILDWLIKTHSIDLRTCLYAHNNTILHIAASRGSLLVISWLLAHHKYLAQTPNACGDIPFETCIKSPSFFDSVALQLLESASAPLPPDWIQLALESTSQNVVSFAKDALRANPKD
ncbi:hypothetical protein HDU97_007343 [Phlyctochytrium planicorne]|nr:hypothetical protein HDU97_007343 [Phlyctochytrium planicorne]